MRPGDKVKYTGPTSDKNEVGTISRIEVNVTGKKVCIVKVMEQDLWTDHARVGDLEKMWSAEHCEVIHATR